MRKKQIALFKPYPYPNNLHIILDGWVQVVIIITPVQD